MNNCSKKRMREIKGEMTSRLRFAQSECSKAQKNAEFNAWPSIKCNAQQAINMLYKVILDATELDRLKQESTE